MSLVEREAKLSSLHGILTDCNKGTGGVALVGGALASGKSTLLDEFSRCEEVGNSFLLRASAAQEEQDHCLGVFQQIFDSIKFLPDSMSNSGYESFDLPTASVVQGGDSRELQVSVLHDIWMLLRRCSENITVVIMVDDVQYSDSESLRVLHYISRRVASARIMLVLSEGVSLNPEYSKFRTGITRQACCREIWLAPLSQPGVATLLNTVLAPDAAHYLAADYFEITGGNPLLMQALLADRHAAGGDYREPVAGEAFRRSVLSCLHRCDRVISDIAYAWATLGEHAPAALAERLADLEAGEGTWAVTALALAGLLDVEGNLREQVRIALYEGISPQERGELHARAAWLCYHDGAPALTVARHLAASGTQVGETMVGLLQEAAEQALAEDDPRSALEFLRLALDSCADKKLEITIINQTIQIEWGIDPAVTRRRADKIISLFQDPEISPQQAIVPICSLLWHGYTAEAADALARLGRDASTSAKISADPFDLLNFLLSYFYPGQFRGPVSWKQADYARIAAEAAAIGRSMMQSYLHAATFLSEIFQNPRSNEAIEGAERLLEVTELDEANLGPINAALLVLVQADRLESAERWSNLLLARAMQRPGPTSQALLSSICARICYRQGNLAESERLVSTALSLITPTGWGVVIGTPISIGVHTAIARGDHATAAEYLSIPVPEAMYQTPCGLNYMSAQGDYRLATGRFRAALADFTACADLAAQWGFPSLLPWRTRMADAMLRMGQTTEARKMLSRELAAADRASYSERAHALRTLAALSDTRDRLRFLREATHLFDLTGDRLELAAALGDLRDAQHVVGENSRARMIGRRARLLAEECGAKPLMRRLAAGSATKGTAFGESADRRELRTPDRFSSLSEAERRVATLAAEGYTNRHIADKLCITVSTVEQHLTRAYRKLGVNGRSALAPSF